MTTIGSRTDRPCASDLTVPFPDRIDRRTPAVHASRSPAHETSFWSLTDLHRDATRPRVNAWSSQEDSR